MAVRVLVAVLLVLSSLISSSATAQESRGTIQGRVVDASGAAVPGASVEVLNLATGVVTPTTTNEQGSYRVPFLNPGQLPRHGELSRDSASSSATTSSCTSPTC